MTTTIRFLNRIGHGAEMSDGTDAFNYFRNYEEITTFDTVTNIYTNKYFNDLGITRVVQNISRSLDEVVIKFWAEDKVVIRVDGVYSGAGKWTDYEIEWIMDQFSPWERTNIIGTKYSDILYSNTWDGAEISGGAGHDRIFGDSIADVLNGGNGNDVIKGDSGKDKVFGGAGDDKLFGEYKDDTIYGEVGDDLIYGGWGNDTMYGGDGADTFAFKRSDHNYARKDVIADFEIGLDTIQFDRGISAKHVSVKQVGEDTVIFVITGYFDKFKIAIENTNLEEFVDSDSIDFF